MKYDRPAGKPPEGVWVTLAKLVVVLFVIWMIWDVTGGSGSDHGCQHDPVPCTTSDYK